MQGDRYRIDIRCAPGAAAHVTTQSATKVFAAHDRHASQVSTFTPKTGAVFEHLPDAVIPFRGSRLFQRRCVTVDRDPTVFLGVVLLPAVSRTTTPPLRRLLGRDRGARRRPVTAVG
jgi:urease accessory protein